MFLILWAAKRFLKIWALYSFFICFGKKYFRKISPSNSTLCIYINILYILQFYRNVRLNFQCNLIVFCCYRHRGVDGCTLFLLMCLFLQKQQTEVLVLCYQSMAPAPIKMPSFLVLFVILLRLKTYISLTSSCWFSGRSYSSSFCSTGP